MLHVVFWHSLIRGDWNDALADTVCKSVAHENSWPWVDKKITRHPSPAVTVYVVQHRYEAAWNELQVSVIEVQYDSMANLVQTILSARDGSCFWYFGIPVNLQSAFKFNNFIFCQFDYKQSISFFCICFSSWCYDFTS